jgi:DNA-binding PadR family transcriptional regulator
MYMGIKEGLLALLADGPRHGYQLKLDLEAATGDAVTINVGQVYTTLHRLERDGLVEDGGNDTEGRAVYRITKHGVATVREWVSKPEDLAAAGRDEISIKVLLALFSPGLDPNQVIETQRRATMGLLQDFTQLRARDNDADLAWQLHLDRLMYSAEAELKWLDRVEERLKSAKPSASGGKTRAFRPAGERVI